MLGGVGAALTAEFCRGVMRLNAAFISLGVIICKGSGQTQLLDVKYRCAEANFIFYRPLLFLLCF